jgi:hypothetical protein
MNFSNPLTWSYSKIEVLNKCPRRYYYFYYSGYIKDVVSPTQEQWDVYLRVLLFKNLKSVNMWVGTMSHTVISNSLIAIHNGQTDLDRLVEAGFKGVAGKIKKEIADSKKKNYARYDKNNKWGLLEHAFGEEVEPEYVIDKFRTALKSFIKSTKEDEVLNSAIAAIPVSKENNFKCYIEDPDNKDWDLMKSRVEGIEIELHLLPDFYIEREKNRFLILDWKTGSPPEQKDEIPSQLKAYSLKILEETSELMKDDTKISGYYVYFPAEEKIGGHIEHQAINEFKANIVSDIQHQKSYLLNGDAIQNIPIAKKRFALTEEVDECKYCNFKIICGR